MSDEQNVWAVYSGPDVIEVFTDEDQAEAWLGTTLMNRSMDVVQRVEAGGTFSILLTRGGTEGILMSGSYALNNPGAGREVSDFRVERLVARNARLADARP